MNVAVDMEAGPADPRWWRLALTAAVAGYAFFCAFSSAGVSISLFVLFVLTLLRPGVFLAARPWREPVLLIGLALFAWIAVHTLVTSGFTKQAGGAINRYHELLFAPMVMVLLRDPAQRRTFLRWLCAGAVLVALAYWVARLPALQADTRLQDEFTLRRISVGFALTVTAFLALMHARQSERPTRWRLLAAFFAATVLFATEGRTGHLLLVALATYAAWVHSPARWRWAALVVAPLLVLGLAMGSGKVQKRVAETFLPTQVIAPDAPSNSTLIRREFMTLALDVAREHGFAGAGYANYARVHEEAAQRRYGNDPQRAHYLQFPWIHTPNPHNEYAMQLAGGGIVALGLFLAWLAATVRTGLRTRGHVGPMITAAAVAFAIGCAFNSMLMDFIEGHFYLGVLALLLAERRWPAPERARTPMRRVLVVTTRQIGDVLLTTPLLRAVRQRWPHAHIDVLGMERSLGMLQGNPDADGLIEIPARPRAGAALALARRLWRSYDLALITDGADRAHLLGWMAARERSGIVPEAGRSNWWKRALLQHAVTAAGDRGSVHAVVEKHALLAPWLPAAPSAPAVPAVTVPPPAPLPPDLAQALQPGSVVVHAPSMWEYKQWPVAHYHAVVQALLAQGRQVILTGSSSPRDRECIAPLRALGTAPQLLDTSGRLDFNQLVTLFRSAALYIGPDTSVSHLAAAAGLPVIAVFGPTNPLRWAPWPGRAEQPVRFVRRAPVQQAGNVTLLQGPQDCVPCGRAGCEDHRGSRSDCLASITPEQVLREAARVLGITASAEIQHA
jgi:heptosyltransferase-3